MSSNLACLDAGVLNAGDSLKKCCWGVRQWGCKALEGGLACELAFKTSIGFDSVVYRVRSPGVVLWKGSMVYFGERRMWRCTERLRPIGGVGSEAVAANKEVRKSSCSSPVGCRGAARPLLCDWIHALGTAHHRIGYLQFCSPPHLCC